MIKKIIKFFERHKAVSIIIMAAILGIMFYCSSLTGLDVQFKTEYPSILYHLGIFFLFGFFLLAAITNKNVKIRDALIAVIISIIVAILDEFHQAFVPFRDSSIQDVLTDSIGSAISIFFCYIFNRN
jgi:VanZ family protein